VCKKWDLWLHVDAAYGGAYACLPELAHRFEGAVSVLLCFDCVFIVFLVVFELSHRFEGACLAHVTALLLNTLSIPSLNNTHQHTSTHINTHQHTLNTAPRPRRVQAHLSRGELPQEAAVPLRPVGAVPVRPAAAAVGALAAPRVSEERGLGVGRGGGL
jgi:hypothetical protein